MATTPISERWLTVTEIGVTLQFLFLPVLYQVGTQDGPIGQQLLAVSVMILVFPIVLMITVGALWQDMQALEQAGVEDISQLLWLSAAVFLPIIGAMAYVSRYARNPVARGLIGRLTSGSDGEQSFADSAEHGRNDEPKSNPDTSDATETVVSPPSPEIDLGIGPQNEVPEFESKDLLDSSNGTEVTLVSLSDPDVMAVKKSPKQGATITRASIESLLEEAETWASVDDHPHIVSVYGWGGTPYPWILVEYVDGGDLRSVMDKTGQSQAIEWLIQLCDGLFHGHERGIYHLDIKPENILIDTAQETARLSDWGSAVRFENGIDSEEFTPAYTAPELLPDSDSPDPSPRSDIFQVGVIAYELLTGVHPFQAEYTDATLTAIESETPTLPSELNSELPRELDEPILKSLEKNPSDRYKTIRELSSDLESFS